MTADRYNFTITCRCGASLTSSKYNADEVDTAVAFFNTDHSECRKWPLVPDLEQRVHALELITGMIEGQPVVVTPT